MRFDPTALWQFISDRLPERGVLSAPKIPSFKMPSLKAVAASGGAALAMATIVYVVWPAGETTPSDQVVVSSPVFRTVALTPPTPVPAIRPGGSAAPGDTDTTNTPDPARFADQVSVVRAVQQQLKRAGCYSGRVNGVWSPATRKAMAEFTSVVNASLPVNRADPVLLVLIESNPGASCTPDCVKDGGSACGSPAAAPPVNAPNAKPQVASLDEDRASGPAGSADEDDADATAAKAPAAAPAPPEKRTAPTPSERGAVPVPSEARRVPAPPEAREIATAQPEPTVSETDVETAALPAAAAISRKAEPTERRVVRKNSARKYKQKSSFNREFNKGMKSLQRSLNKLF
ncbi:peptidoglycan-binding domain-containing protein [Hyphomicrobium sp.]|uniref:peptidoglycan-binding domain-containing protein n=1 Tax=Hyphomicrobium sp. TaxID=82 RepID=UPI003F6EC520